MTNQSLPIAEAPLPFQISEIFGPTLQGEGPDVGKACAFLRLHNCPVHCPGCDTHYTWDGSETGKAMSFSDAAAKLNFIRQGAGRWPINYSKSVLGLVLSGGEPLLYYKVPELTHLLCRGAWSWMGLETSGFAGMVERMALYNFLAGFSSISLSPKITPCLHGRQSDEDLEVNIPAFLWAVGKLGTIRERIVDRLFFKFVVRDDADINAVLACEKRHGFMEKGLATYLMPYGNDRDEILKSIEALIPAAAKYGFIVTPRLQALLWGATRGV